jgi:hypothetical protein
MDTGNDERILLTPKAFAIPRHLVEDAGRPVNQDELLKRVSRFSIHWSELIWCIDQLSRAGAGFGCRRNTIGRYLVRFTAATRPG